MIEVVLPTLNEEEGLPLVIESLKKRGMDNIVVVDGHSTDKTIEIARKHNAKIVMQEGKGKGMAFQTFLQKYPIKDDNFYIMLDSDNSYDAADIDKFISSLKSCDVVTGNRVTIRYNPNDFIHYLGNKLISFGALVLFLRWNPDICTGYWGFRGSALKKMKIRSKGFDLEADLFCQIVKKELSHKIVPINYYTRVGERKLNYFDALIIVSRLVIERFRKD
jgi:glycosyltransferase involved in cell wall biosynthesis